MSFAKLTLHMGSTVQTPPDVAPGPTGLVPADALAPFSLVCKAVAANGRATVKLSDNPLKAMGPSAEVERYKRVFGVGEQVGMAVVV